MHHITTTILLAGTALSVSFGVQAQSSTSGDLSRYESIYEATKDSRGQVTPHFLPKDTGPNKRVETISPSIKYAGPRVSAAGISETPQPIVRPSISMKADGTELMVRAPVPVAAPVQVGSQGSDARIKETTTDEGKGGVINGVMRTP